MSPAAAGRNPHIDFLRGVSIFCVLCLHFTLAYRFTASPLAAVFSRAQLETIFFNGNFGVTMFFVISGFLITANSLARWGEPRNVDWRAFYVLRLARIMPCLVAVLAIIVTLGLLGVPNFTNTGGGHALPASFFLIAVASVLSFWHNVLMESVGYFNYCLNIYWSLSVEEVFYLALPIVFLTVRRISLISILCLALIAYGPIYRGRHADDELYFMYGYFACFDAIAFGCLTAILARKVSPSPRSSLALRVAAGLVMAIVYFRGIDGHEVFGFSLLALGTAVYLLGSAHSGSANRRARAPGWVVRWMGQHSYECYLFHIVVLALMRNLIAPGQLGYAAWLPWMVLFLVTTGIVAALVSRAISDPANAAIRHWYWRRR